MQKHLCNPALLYVIFASVQIIFDLFNEMWMLAITKSFVAIIFTFVLNMLCVNGMSIISWILVIIPFLFTLLLVEILIFILGFTAVTSVTALENDSELKDNNKNNKNQFIDISYAETPHIEHIEELNQIEQIDDFNMDS
jgi:hypothetical protein